MASGLSLRCGYASRMKADIWYCSFPHMSHNIREKRLPPFFVIHCAFNGVKLVNSNVPAYLPSRLSAGLPASGRRRMRRFVLLGARRSRIYAERYHRVWIDKRAALREVKYRKALLAVKYLRYFPPKFGKIGYP